LSRRLHPSAMFCVAVLGLLIGGSLGVGAQAEADPTPAAKTTAAPVTDAPAAIGSPRADVTPDAAAAKAQAEADAAAAKAKAEAMESCKKTAAGLNAADLAALKALPADRQTILMKAPSSISLMTCLTVAENDDRFCKMLTDKDQQERCLQHWKQVAEIKALPKEQVKANVIYRSCIEGTAKADCDALRDAMVANDVAKCKAVSSELRSFCEAVVTGDAGKCKGLPAGEDRGRCEAYATEDESRCPKDSIDCHNMARNFAGFRKSGLAGVQGIDPSAAAAVNGRQACASYVTEFERLCTEGN